MRWKALPVLAAAIMLVLLGCGDHRTGGAGSSGVEPTSCDVPGPAELTIATGNATGVSYALGGVYAEAINSATGGVFEAKAEQSPGSLQNIRQLVAGTKQVAFALADTAGDAVEGKASFDSPQPIAALTRLYPNYAQVIVRSDSGIQTVADMRGKRVSTGAPDSGTEVIANRMLAAAGLDPARDVRVERAELARTVEEMKTGSVDAMFYSGGLPTAGIADLIASQGERVRFIDVTDTLPTLEAINTIYERGVIPAAVYGTPTEVPTVVVPNVLLVNQNMDGNTACVLTKVLFERRADLVEVNEAADGIVLGYARQVSPVPLHPGAARALDELGAAD